MLRRSVMIYFTNLASLGLIISVAAQLGFQGSGWIPWLTLALAVAMLVGALATRLETAPHEPTPSPR